MKADCSKISNLTTVDLSNYLQKKCLTPKSIHAEVVRTLGNETPGLSTVHKRATEFRSRMEDIEDCPRSGRPVTTTTAENIDRVDHIVIDDRRFIINQISDAISISRDNAENILHKTACENLNSSRHMNLFS